MTFTINNKTYKAKDVTFNFMCLLEDRGLPIDQIDNKPMKVGREYLAYCGGMSSEEAGDEIEKHIISGGNLSGLYDAFTNAISESDFFQALGKAQNTPTEEETAEETVVTPKKSRKNS